MNDYELTLKQYQDKKLKEFKTTKYWENSLKLKKEMRDNLLKSKMAKWKNEWYDLIIEYGKDNKLSNKVIYSFDREYGREHLMHCFRGGRKGLEGWINSDAIGY